MYASIVGKTFLKEYNRQNKTYYSPKELFEKELYETLFNHKKFMFYVNNSPFDQLVKQKKTSNQASRKAALEKLHEKIKNGEVDGSTAVGFPAAANKNFATTSGLVSTVSRNIGPEEIYLSWIGGSLTLGLGLYNVLFNDPKITYATFEGWKHYRNYLNDPSLEKIPAYKLNTWNGQWLTYRFSKSYNENFQFTSLINEDIFKILDQKIEINTVSWSQLYFSLSHSLKKESRTAYIFTLGSTNKTVGFIPFNLLSGRKLQNTYQSLFSQSEVKLNETKDFEKHFGRNLKGACSLGTIGIQALRPKSIKKYLDNKIIIKFPSPVIRPKKGESSEALAERKKNAFAKEYETIISYQTYKTWLVTMLSKNKSDISDYSRDIAAALVKYRKGGRKSDRKLLLEKEFFKTNKNEVLRALDVIVSDESVNQEIAEKMNGLRDQIHFLNREDFKYFILLLNFDFAFAERNSQTLKS